MAASSHLKSELWTSNALFFVGTHVLGVVALWTYPPWRAKLQTLLMLPLLWNAAMFGITVGYHRLWSHRSFHASIVVRIVLAFCGSMAVQGSIKWWCLRHRLHHRFTDDPIHDPYAVTRGMLFAHMGWIFFKPDYPRMTTIDKDDLDRDPIVSMQHRLYIPIAIFSGFLFPTMLGALWGDAIGGFFYGALWTRISIWHCTFCINSLAHWHGLQPYTDEVTARGNLLLALITNGEGNHNFHVRIAGRSSKNITHSQHAFPHDFRSSIHRTEWDPSQWLIILLRWARLVWGLRRARDSDITWAQVNMQRKGIQTQEYRIDRHMPLSQLDSADDHNDMQVWTYTEVVNYVAASNSCVLVIDGYAVDVSSYLGEHPGGAKVIQKYAVRASTHPESQEWRKGTWAFHGGINNHTRIAMKRFQELRIARVSI